MKQIAWITGASGGIGQSIANALATEGIHIAAGFHQNDQAAKRVVVQCQQKGVSAIAVRCDVSSKESVQSAYNEVINGLGHPNILIHAAGVSSFGLFQDMTDEQYDQVMDVHVRGAFYLIKTALPAFIRRKQGRIILISSIWGTVGAAGEVLYSAAKGAINSLTKALAKELAPSQITVNAVAPGAVKTKMLDQQLDHHEQQALIQEIPMGRLGRAKEIASLVAYLCREEAGYLTGQVLHVNGGWYL